MGKTFYRTSDTIEETRAPWYANARPRAKSNARPIRKTTNMIRATTIFGKATGLSKELMTSLTFQLPVGYSMARRNKLTGLFNKALIKQWDKQKNEFNLSTKGFRPLNGFEFDSGFTVASLFSEFPVVSLTENVLTVNIGPLNLEEDITFYSRSSRCKLIVGVSFFKLTRGLKVELSENKIITVDKLKKVVGPYRLDFVVPTGCLCVVTLFLDYFCAGKAGWKSITQKEFAPGCILSSVYVSGNAMETDDRKWILSSVDCLDI